ncbi:hypothetical protein BU23DRAFT_182548 [Bimuria novae-zelandiae CBS 107.79]|uniref:Uncharacterized protein n=1 Tax=Bimuria novae-zelandiae CBS 107.79 TaxID=1447943 RepID=A0A6A5V1X1_9PLEO|nr:hypothetical protein BU23DRAFT_182548 [Bimuria novae-zelandiae CBS 107.79]
MAATLPHNENEDRDDQRSVQETRNRYPAYGGDRALVLALAPPHRKVRPAIIDNTNFGRLRQHKSGGVCPILRYALRLANCFCRWCAVWLGHEPFPPPQPRAGPLLVDRPATSQMTPSSLSSPASSSFGFLLYSQHRAVQETRPIESSAHQTYPLCHVSSGQLEFISLLICRSQIPYRSIAYH